MLSFGTFARVGIFAGALVHAGAIAGAQRGATVDTNTAVPISPPATPLPSEDASRNVTKFSFIAYGDTRGAFDGSLLQYDHSLVVASMLRAIQSRAATDDPIKFVVQSGDAVVDGRSANQLNVSYVPVINRLAPRCEELDHHPDLALRWRWVEIELSTHSAGGVTDLDLTLAGIVDEVAAELPLAGEDG